MSAMTFSFPIFKALTTTGTLGPLAGGLLHTFEAGTSTPLAVYQDAALTVPHTNPVVLDSNGQATIYLGPNAYKMRLEDSTGAVQPGWPIDGIEDPLDNAKDYTDTLRADLAASSGSSMVGFLQSGTGAVARTVQDKGRDVITSADFPTLQECIDAAYGSRLVVKSGTHEITAQLTIDDSINIEMEPGAVIDFSGAAAGVSLSEKRAISIEGTLGADVPLTANVTVGATTVTVAAASSADFVAGSYVEIVSTELYMSGAAAGSPSRGHMTRVKSVDTGTGIITLTDRSPFSYATASSASIRLLTMVDGVKIAGGKILGGGTGLVHNGIYAYCAANLVVDGVEIDGCEDTGVSTKHCWAPRIDRCVISNCTSPDPGVGNTGYGVAFYDGTRGGVIHQNSIRNCRHSVSGGNSPCVIYADVSDNHISGCGIGVAALDCHEPCFFWTIRGNTVIGGAEGIGIRGQKSIVSGNIVQGVDGVGVHVKTYTNNTEGINGTVISNNEIYNTGLNGILLEGRNTNERIHKSIISGNRIDSCGLSGITGLYVNGAEIVGNDISNILTSTGSDGNGIRMVGAALGDVANVSISANNISNTLRHGIFIQYGMGISMGQNNIFSITTNGVNCQLSDGVSIVGGRVDVSTSTAAAIAIDRTDRVSIAAAYILGNAVAASQDGIVVTASSGSSDSIICNGVIVNGAGRYGFYSTNSDRVIVTGCDMRDAVNATKINIVGATTSVSTDNVV